MYERLIKCGFTAQMAQDICILYADDPQGLLAYVEIAESLYRGWQSCINILTQIPAEKRVRLHCPCDL